MDAKRKEVYWPFTYQNECDSEASSWTSEPVNLSRTSLGLTVILHRRLCSESSHSRFFEFSSNAEAGL